MAHVILATNFLHVIVLVVVNRVCYPENIVFGGDSCSTPSVVVHAAPEGAAAAYAVRYEYVGVINKL